MGDRKFRNHSPNDWLTTNTWHVIEVFGRPKGGKTFEVIPWRWAVEHTYAWLGRCRMHSRDYERHAASSEALVQVSMIHLKLRRLAGEENDSPSR